MAHRPNGNYGRFPPPPYPPPYRRPPQMWPDAPPAYPPYPPYQPMPGFGYEGGQPHGFFGAPPQHWQPARRGNVGGHAVQPPSGPSAPSVNVASSGENKQTPALANVPTPVAPEGRPAAPSSDFRATQPDKAPESSAHRSPVMTGNALADAIEALVAAPTSSNTPTPPSPPDVHPQSYAGLKRENAELKDELNAMKAQMSALTETWDAARSLLEAEKNRFKTNSGEAQKEIAELKAKIKTLEAQSGVAVLRKQVEDLSGKCQDLEVENKGLIDLLASYEEPQPQKELNSKEFREVEVQTERKEEKDVSVQTAITELATVEKQTDSSAAIETPELPKTNSSAAIDTPEVPTPESPTAAKKSSEAPANSSPIKKPTPEPPTAAKKPSEAPADSSPTKKPRPEPPTAAKKSSEAPTDSSPTKKPKTGQKRAHAPNPVRVGFTHQGHNYHYGDQRGGGRSRIASTFWDCDREGCTARVRTSRETGEVINSIGGHNHPPASAMNAESGGQAVAHQSETAHSTGTAEDPKPESDQASTPEVGTSDQDHRPPRAKRSRQLMKEALDSSTGSETDARSGSRASEPAAQPNRGGGDEPVALLDHPYNTGAQVRVPLGAYSDRRIRLMFESIVSRRIRGISDAHIEGRLREVAAAGNKDASAVSLFQHVLPFVPKP